MNDLVWCQSCETEVSLAHAIAELPCPQCGGKEYFVCADNCRESLLDLSERMQRIGSWEIAEAALRNSRDEGYISGADYKLSSAGLSFRRQCADEAVRFIGSSSRAVTVDELRAALSAAYDDYTIGWVLTEFRSLRMIPFDNTFVVEVSYAAQKAKR